jgi:hypothetical protein
VDLKRRRIALTMKLQDVTGAGRGKPADAGAGRTPSAGKPAPGKPAPGKPTANKTAAAGTSMAAAFAKLSQPE